MADPYDCPDCGQTHPRGCRGHVDECADCQWRGANHVDKPCHKCGAQVVLRPCRRHPRKGGDKCPSHGGNSPRALAANARRLAHDEAAESLAHIAVTPIGDPLDALAHIAAEAVAAKNHFADLVATLGQDMAFVTGKASIDKDGLAHLEQKLDARVALWERFMDRSQKYLVDWIRLGFDERKAQLDDARANLIRAVLVGVLTDLGHQLDDRPVRDSLARWLPVLDGRPPPSIDGGPTE